jgi:pimeloyl-ACP methyl ester carboxylesterase
MTIYCFSGLGADQRAFQFLDLADHKLVHIDWIRPIEDETLPKYAARISSQIDTSIDFAIIGVSFGGIVAVEVAKRIGNCKLFIISSVIRRNELPKRYKLLGFFNLHKFLPSSLFVQSNWLINYLFGVRTEIEKALLNKILKDTDPSFVEWALGAVLKWKNSETPNCIRIHGTKDKILPIGNMKIDHLIEDGGHFTIVSHADEITKIILNSL